MLYITRLELRNIRRFTQLVIEFREARSCSVLVGDNGDGKSTVLRSLAMGLCDQGSAAALLRELPGEFVRHDSEGDSFVQVDLAGAGGWQYRINTRFIGLGRFERVEQKYYEKKGKGKFHKIDEYAFPWAEIFVTGYGPGIRTFGNADYSYYLAVDAVYSLFRYDAALQSPELVIRRLVDEARGRSLNRGRNTLDRLREALAELLHLENTKAIELNRRGITVRGAWGQEELAALGDGYRATTTWTLDLMSWWLLHNDEPAHGFKAANLVGIVIIDELEQHLHPRWQRTILPDLRKLFPQIQFIVATHSPLVASSCSDVTVHRLDDGEHSEHLPYGWRAEDVYEMMGVPTSRAESFEDNVIAEFERLDKKKIKGGLSRAEAARLRHLRSELKRLPSEDPTRVGIELKNMIDSLKAKS
ncbi:MAG TPA: AAA family ATPase [Chthoniobacterales bacterium]|nr:AAA family ATPase [Chthoniobacterales bacterium]